MVPLHTRVRDTSLQLETSAAIFQEYPTASSSESFLHEEDSRARGGCQWQGLALLQHPGPPASSLVWGPGSSAAASLWLRWLSSEFEALAARRRVGICGWNSSAYTKERREERRGGTHKLWFPNLFLLIHNFGNATCQFHWGKTRKMTGTECAYSQWPSIT